MICCTLQQHLSAPWKHVEGEQETAHHALSCLMSWGLLCTVLRCFSFTYLMLFFHNLPLLCSTFTYPGVVEIPTHFSWVLLDMKLSDSATLHLPRLLSSQKATFLLFWLYLPCSVLSQLCPHHFYEHIIHMHNRETHTVITSLLNHSLSCRLIPACLLILWLFLDDKSFL